MKWKKIMNEWHDNKTLPKFYGDETDFVEVELIDGSIEYLCFRKDGIGTILADTGTILYLLKDIKRWREIDIY